MATQLNILFMALVSRSNAKGEAPIYCRLTHNQRKQRFMIGCTVPIDIWDQAKQKATGKSAKAISVNQYIINTEQRIHLAEALLLKQEDDFEVEDIIDSVLGRERRACRTLMQLYAYKFNQMEKLKDIDYKQTTLDKFLQLADAVRGYIKATYNTEDISISKVNAGFIANLEVYLKADRHLKQVSLNKVIQKLKAVMKIAADNNWTSKNPFPEHKFRHDKTEVIYLTIDDLQKLESYRFAQQRLSRVRDIFLFSVYTGLHYKDAMELNRHHIITGVDNKLWIKYCRTKTETWIHIPLLSKAKELLQQFQSEMSGSQYLVPRISNQKFNSYIKEVGEIAGVTVPLSHKVARKTFGSVLIYHDVPMKVVSELMGHSSVLITERHYAKVELKKLGEEMTGIDTRF